MKSKFLFPNKALKPKPSLLKQTEKLSRHKLQESFPTATATRNYLSNQKGATFQVAANTEKTRKKISSPTIYNLPVGSGTKAPVFGGRTVGQRLYENGYITYMRTDSVNLSKEAQKAAAEAIGDRYGANYVNTKNFKTKNKSAQEAHEAIRPTNLAADQVHNGSRSVAPVPIEFGNAPLHLK